MEAHGHVRDDPWFWLRNLEDPAVLEYLKAENAWTKKTLEPLKRLEESLFAEMRARIRETDLSAPVRHGDYLYYSRSEEGSDYSIIARRLKSMESPEQIILDCNERAEGKDYYDIVHYAISPDHQTAAILENFDGTDKCVLSFRSLATGEWSKEVVENVSYDSKGVWAADNLSFFYLKVDDTQRAAFLIRHRLGESSEKDRLVYEESDPEFSLDLNRTRDGSWLILKSYNSETEESRILPTNSPEGEWIVVEPRTDGLRYTIDHADDRFWILTNADGADNMKLMSTGEDNFSRKFWKEFLPYDPLIVLEGALFFKDWMVLRTSEKGLSCLRFTDYQGQSRKVEFPEPAYSLSTSGNPEFETTSLRISYSSGITPKSIIEIDAESLEQKILKRTEVVGGFDPDDYIVERLEATASDGTKVPISLIRRREAPLDGSASLLLEAYGSYGDCLDPYFDSSLFSLLDRGFVKAIAHVRGGGEMGRDWYAQGKLDKKMNTFTDFIACAEHLVAKGYTSPGHLCASGTSAGGLLVGAVVNLRPDLFCSVVANAPFVDCLSSMSDPTLPLTTSEYVEWGNPESEHDYRSILSYSPYDNVGEKSYPGIYVTAGLNDPRVAYWEPAKWVAKLRDSNLGKRPILLAMNLDGGHSGSSGFVDDLKELAREYAFHLWMVGKASVDPIPE